MTRALLALLLLTGCASEPGWRTVEFVAIPRLQGGVCYVAKPATTWNWQAQYSAMVQQCATQSVITKADEENGT